MFWKKKPEPQSPGPSPGRGMSLDNPRPQPILKTCPDHGGGPSIRFAGASPRPVPTHVSAQWPYVPPSPDSMVPSPSPVASPAIQRIQAPRRSSRPSSPSATSFGARIPPHQAVPIAAAHVTTPPAAYISSIQSRAPPSPYRPTSERRGDTQFASRPPRISSLFETPSAPGRFAPGRSPGDVADEHLPTFNIIPATPQALGDEWGMRRSASGPALEGAFTDDMVDIPLEASASAPAMETISELPASDSLPAIADLEFSPFDMTVSLPSLDSGSSISSLPYSSDRNHSAPLLSMSQAPPQEPLPSPPFESYPSLPSLDSERSLPSSTSQSSLRSSASTSSLASYSDVEEALGSMLASLSDPSMLPPREKSNPGLGLGLALPPSASITAPLHPRRRPPPLDLSSTSREAAGPDMQSAPARINHRVAFYTTARAAPNSSTSGTFSNSSHHTEFIMPSPPRSDSDGSLMSDDTQLAKGWRDSVRSSISCGSEASDDDPYTASIVCLMPVKGGVAALCRDQYGSEVGLAM